MRSDLGSTRPASVFEGSIYTQVVYLILNPSQSLVTFLKLERKNVEQERSLRRVFIFLLRVCSNLSLPLPSITVRSRKDYHIHQYPKLTPHPAPSSCLNACHHPAGKPTIRPRRALPPDSRVELQRRIWGTRLEREEYWSRCRWGDERCCP